MEDTDIMIDVQRDWMSSDRYVIVAHYNGEENIRGSAHAGVGFCSLIAGRSLQDEINLATRDAIKDLKYNYNKHIMEKDHIKSLTSKAQSYVEKCVKGNEQ